MAARPSVLRGAVGRLEEENASNWQLIARLAEQLDTAAAALATLVPDVVQEARAAMALWARRAGQADGAGPVAAADGRETPPPPPPLP